MILASRLRSARAGASARRGDLVAIGVLVLLVFCYFAPAIKDGSWFFPGDLARGLSNLTGSLHAKPNHNDINGDIATQGVPWYLVNWRLVHHGELPLWSSLTGNGMPELLNFESGTFALPSLVSYLFPVSAAFLVTMALKLLIAGIGTYVFVRLCRVGPLGALMAAVTYMFSGSLTGWLGWSISGVFCWLGFVAAGLLVCYRGRGRRRELAVLAVPVAFMVFGGFPEAYALSAICLVACACAAGASALIQARRIDLGGVVRAGAGVVLGLLLSAPLWFAGLPVLTGSVRNGGDAAVGLPSSTLALVFAEGYDGLPTEYHATVPQAARFFGPTNYYESAAYVGVLALALALVALVCAFRRPIVAGLAAMGLAAGLIAYRIGAHDPVQHLMRLVGLGAIDTDRVLAVVGFAVACLSGIGLEQLVRRAGSRAVWRSLWAALGVLALVDLVLALATGRVPALYRPDRLRSLIWPTGSLAVAAGFLLAYGRRRRRPPSAGARRALVVTGAAFVALESGFGLFAGVGLNSYVASPFDVTAAVARLQAVVGTRLVGIDDGEQSCAGTTTGICGVKGWNGEGFYPNLNVDYGIDELGLHDPVIPRATFATWPVPDAGQSLGGTNLFLPDIDTVALARDYGVSYVLVRPGEPAPAGMREVATVPGDLGASGLYAVPHSSRFAFASSGARVVSARQLDDADYVVHVAVSRETLLRVKITAFSGWHVAANGRALAVEVGPNDLLEVEVPPGTTTIALSYWPRRLTEGFIASGIAALALALDALLRGRATRRGRWARPQAAGPGTGGLAR